MEKVGPRPCLRVLTVTATLSSLPPEQSTSRWPGKRRRGSARSRYIILALHTQRCSPSKIALMYWSAAPGRLASGEDDGQC